MKRNHLQRSLDFKEQEAGSGMDTIVIKQVDLRVFDFEGKQARVMMQDGTPWWVGKDICDILGYVDSTNAIGRYCKHASVLKSSDSRLLDIPSEGLSIIPESDIFRLSIPSSKAEKFETWVMEEVFPAIREYGAYAAQQKATEIFVPLVIELKQAQDALKAAEEKIAALEEQNKQNKLKLSYGQTVQDSFDRHETFLYGRFTNYRYLDKEGLLLAWLAPGAFPTGMVSPSAEQEHSPATNKQQRG